jgi:uncharacterized membrane protein YdjX (TVP38/TMEM64 family)
MSQTVSTTPATAWLPKAWRRALALALLAVALAVVTLLPDLHGWLMGTLPTAEAIIRQQALLGMAIFVAFAALSAMLAFVSSAVIVPVGIYVWGKAATLLLLWVGWILGGFTAYTLSRYFGRPVVHALLPRAMFERYANIIPRRAPFRFVLLLQLALPSEVPGYLLGLMRYHFGRYIAALALAELPYAVATIYLGASFLERRTYVVIILGVLLALFAGWSLHALHRQVSRRKWRQRTGDQAKTDPSPHTE